MNKRLASTISFCSAIGLLLASCAGMETKPTESSFMAPTVKLSSIQPSYYEGFWYYGKAEPEMGKAPAGGGSSPVTLDFVFDITNPNSFPVKYESSSFFLFFDEYELRIVNDTNPMWIPPGKTNSKVLNVTLTPTSTYAKFTLAGRDLLPKEGISRGRRFSSGGKNSLTCPFPIDLKEGNFTFSADGIVKAVPVMMRYP